MKVATASQMRSIDTKAIQGMGIPGVVLMENAGLRVVELIEAKLHGLYGLDVVVVCGKGNNGGDGFVIARHLSDAGANVRVFAVAAATEFAGDAAIQLRICKSTALSITHLGELGEMERLSHVLNRCDLVVDALLGTGFSGLPRGIVGQTIEALSGCPAPVVSVDVPSGVESDSGRVPGPAVSAHWTVTFGLPKVGLLIHPGCENAGEVWLGDIGIPPDLVADSPTQCSLATDERVAAMLPVRAPDAHKGSCGRIGIVAGCARYAGAAVLAGRAAMRSGAGIVTLVVPAGINNVVKAGAIETTTWPAAETESGSLAVKGFEGEAPLLKDVDSLAIGPGLSRDEETLAVVRQMLSSATVPAVLDADALFAFAGNAESLRQYGCSKVLTPHPGEMAALLGIAVHEVQDNRIDVAREAAEATGAVIVLKGARTVIAAPDGRVHINPTGNPGMASGGTGDVLTGVIVSLLGQGLDLTQATTAGVYLHGMAGNLAATDKGESGLIAGDLVENLPYAFEIVRKRNRGESVNSRLRRLI